MNLKRIVSAFRRKNPAPAEDSPPFTAEQLKKVKVSSKTLERDILEQREIRRIETPSGRRAFFRGVAGAVGLKVLAEKVPESYFEDNVFDFFPEAEGHENFTSKIYYHRGQERRSCDGHHWIGASRYAHNRDGIKCTTHYYYGPISPR